MAEDREFRERVEAAARHFFAEHRAKQVLAGLPEGLRPRDLAEADAMQDRLQGLYLEAGSRIAGWKVALTTPVMQRLVGIDQPCEGGIFAERVHRQEADLRAADYETIGVESEIAVRLAGDLDGAGTPYDRASVRDAVGALMAAIEIVDDRSMDYGKLDALLLVADNSFNFGCVVGPEVTDWRGLDLERISGRMRINGEVVGEGAGADVMGHPFEALAWLANNLVGRGSRLRAGDIVMTGSIVSTKWLKAGDEMATEIDGLGEARLRLS